MLIGGFFILNSYIYHEKQADTADDYKNISYVIDEERVRFGNEWRYFGNELYTDLNNDGREDVVFLVTHEPGGSGTFYYAVAALNTEDGYIGSDGYLLGDRIAPQTIEVSSNPRHVNVIVVNYADRADGEPMTAQPSVGKSVYLKLDPAYMQWGIVEPDFEGESNVPAGGELITGFEECAAAGYPVGESYPRQCWTPDGGHFVEDVNGSQGGTVGDPIAVRGEITCLPKRATGPQTLECAIGLKADDNGGFYALKNLFGHDPNYYALSQTGARLEVIGSVTQEEMHGPDGNPYDIVGVITITSIQQL